MTENISTSWSAILDAVTKIQPAYRIFVLLAIVFIGWMYFSQSKIDPTVGAAMVLFLVFAFGCFAFFLENKDRELARLKEVKSILERQLRYAGEDYVRSKYQRTTGTEGAQDDNSVSEPSRPHGPDSQ